MQAFNAGLLRPDPTLNVPRMEPLAPPPEEVEEATEEQAEEVAEDAPAAPPTPAAAPQSYSLQVDTADAGALERAERAIRGIPGVSSAFTSSIALGGTSVIRVTFAGDAAALQAALQSRGVRVQAVR